jgi:hypothetical protein
MIGILKIDDVTGYSLWGTNGPNFRPLNEKGKISTEDWESLAMSRAGPGPHYIGRI